MSNISDFFQKFGENKLFIVLAGAAAGALLTKLLPALWGSSLNFLAWIGRILGGRFAFRSFERKYLDWIVTDLSDLKLTGIVSTDEAKKPKLEQVFVSLSFSRRFSKGDAEAPYVPAAFLTFAEAAQLLAAARHWKDAASHLIDEARRSLRENRVMRRKVRRRVILPLRSDLSIGTEHDRPVSDQALIGNWLAGNSLALSRTVERSQLRYILHEHKRIGILGSPGAGKTTLLQWIALAFAREKCGDPKLRLKGCARRHLGSSEWRLPIFVRLSSLASIISETKFQDRDPALSDVLPRLLPPDLQKTPVASKYLTARIKSGGVIFLLDGLDEVPTEGDFHTVVRTIESIMVAHPGNQFVITSRVAGWRGGVRGDMEVFHVNELTNDQVNVFVETWYRAVELNAVIGRLQDEPIAERNARERRAQQRAEDLEVTLRDNLGIRRLASSPMLLSIIAVVHRSLATLPRERSKLYSQCSKILLEQWDISRGVRVDDTNLKLEQKETIMRRLAFAFHVGEIGDSAGGREASRSQVVSIISLILPDLGRTGEDAGRLLQILVERSGILVERRQGVLSFAHLTFQEYFAAQHLSFGGLIEHQEFLLHKSRLLSQWWREVILLYSGLLADSSDFIYLVFYDADDDLFRQRLRIAAACLDEAVKIGRIDTRLEIGRHLLMVREKSSSAAVAADLLGVIPYLTQWSRSASWFSNAPVLTINESPEGNGSKLIREAKEALAGTEIDQRLGALAALAYLANVDQATLQTVARLLIGDNNEAVREGAFNVLMAHRYVGDTEYVRWVVREAFDGDDSALKLLTELPCDLVNPHLSIAFGFIEKGPRSAAGLQRVLEGIGHSIEVEDARRIFTIVLSSDYSWDWIEILTKLPTAKDLTEEFLLPAVTKFKHERTGGAAIIIALASRFNVPLNREILVKDLKDLAASSRKLRSAISSQVTSLSSIDPAIFRAFVESWSRSSTGREDAIFGEFLSNVQSRVKLSGWNEIFEYLLQSNNPAKRSLALRHLEQLPRHELGSHLFRLLLQIGNDASRSAMERSMAIQVVSALAQDSQCRELLGCIEGGLVAKQLFVRLAAAEASARVWDLVAAQGLSDTVLRIILAIGEKKRNWRRSAWFSSTLVRALERVGSKTQNTAIFRLLLDRYIDGVADDRRLRLIRLWLGWATGLGAVGEGAARSRGTGALTFRSIVTVGRQIPEEQLRSVLMDVSQASARAREIALLLAGTILKSKGPGVTTFRSMIIPALDDKEEQIRFAAVRAVGDLCEGWSGQQDFGPLVTKLLDERISIREEAWKTLRRLGVITG
ncbi:MAG: hypothetical protein QOH06_2791 [Acidobacteriota bacterium]|nr:hypothetical protein [Acidobacteriota bacterium]